MTLAFTKLASSITESTVWGEPYATRICWIVMLAMADRHGHVHASVPGLAHRARITLEECEAALKTFSTPDRYSRTPDHEGRRIEPIDGGWRLLNYLKYRDTRDADSKREADAARQRRHRANRRAAIAPAPTSGTEQPAGCHGKIVTWRDNRDSHAMSQEVAQAEAEAEAERRKEHPPTPRKRGKASLSLGIDFLLSAGVEEQVARDWLAVRARKKMPLTETAWKFLVREARSAGISPVDAVKICAEKGWGSFEARFLTDRRSNGATPPAPAPRETVRSLDEVGV
ncbi:MAG: hypothetical protein VYC42_01665 [Pseudomonadota bacterium]|nr:hypothetical protein [Pseudomonadota bacterium]